MLADVHEKSLRNERHWESSVPICTFGDNGIESTELRPIEQGYCEEPPRHGRPRYMDEPTAERVIKRIAEQSEPCDKTISFKYGAEIVELYFYIAEYGAVPFGKFPQ